MLWCSTKQNLIRVIKDQFLIPGYKTPYRFDGNLDGCGIMLCMTEHTPSKFPRAEPLPMKAFFRIKSKEKEMVFKLVI